MADTTSITALNTEWTQVIGATLQAQITPVIPGNTFLIRYATVKPADTVLTGHKFFAKDDEPNAIVGSLLAEICWIRSINVNNLEVIVTEL